MATPTTTAPDASDGLRARNRERTMRSLEEAAWEIVAESGFEAVTADAVADRAGVSRRTFFNYFPKVELVIQVRLRSTISGLVDRFIARPRDETLHESLIAVLSEPLPAEVLERSVMLFEQTQHSAAARAFLAEAQAAEAQEIAQVLLTCDAVGDDPLAADVISRAVMSTGCAATEAWVIQTGGTLDDAGRQVHLNLLRQAFTSLATAFIPTAADDAGTRDLSERD